MTLFITFIATANIAFGYGLAVYLGHGQLPWAVGTLTLPRFRSKTATADDQVAAEAVDEPVSLAEEEQTPSPQVVAEKPVEVVPSAKPEVEQVAVKEPEPVVEPASQVTEVADASAAEPEVPEEKVVAEVKTPSVDAAAEPAVQAEAKDEPKPAAADSETPAAEVVVEPATPASEKEAEVEAVVVEAKEPAASLAETEDIAQASTSEGEVDEKFLEGIAAFQNQLKKQEVEPEGDAPSETAQAAAEGQESSGKEPSPKGEEVLAGIESFRAQLASMQQEPEAVEEEPATQPAS